MKPRRTSPHESGRCATFLSSLSDFRAYSTTLTTRSCPASLTISVSHMLNICATSTPANPASLMPFNAGQLLFRNVPLRWESTLAQRPTMLPSTLSACILTSCGLPWQAAETAYLVSKGAHDTCVQDHKATITAKLTTGIRDAVQAYLEGCVSTLLKYMGRQGNLDPWLAQVSSQAMGFQSRILTQTAEYAGLPMELRSAAVMQQLEMFIATARMLPLTCPLSYPVPTPRAHPMGVSAPVGQDQRAEDAGHGVDKDRSSSAAKHSMTTVSCTAASAPKLSMAARPVAQFTAAVGASWLVSLTPARDRLLPLAREQQAHPRSFPFGTYQEVIATHRSWAWASFPRRRAETFPSLRLLHSLVRSLHRFPLKWLLSRPSLRQPPRLPQ